MIYALLLLCGLVLILLAFGQYQHTMHLVKRGESVKAKVVELIASTDSEGTSYKPVFEFVTTTNFVRRFEHEISTRPASWKIGEEAYVLYDPENHRDVKLIGYWGLFRWPIILACAAAPLLISGGGYFVYLWTMGKGFGEG